ncbi:MAG: acyl-CoA dehydrogenase family protein, partial [Candidatus Binataceae bacterium]
MDFSYTPDEEAFRLRARQWLEANAPRDIPDRGFSLPTDPASIEALRDWQRRLFEAGFLGLSWPVEYGGQGKTIVYSAILSEEMARARAPSALNLIGLSMAAPTILEHGTEEQQRRFVPRILSCEEIWCQGFSEPGAGSDLAALKSRAELAGDEFVVNGAKVWTSHGQIADWCMLLVRTEP